MIEGQITLARLSAGNTHIHENRMREEVLYIGAALDIDRKKKDKNHKRSKFPAENFR